MKREFPFGWAVIFALVLHILIGVVLKQHPLLIASPAPPAANAGPVRMHFVESPPEAKSVPSNPDAKYLSDATRKAGPLVKTEKRKPATMQYGGRTRTQAPRTGPGQREEPSKQQAQAEMPALPQIEQPPVRQAPQGAGEYRIPDSNKNTNEKRLNESLKNLDQFIGSGPGATSEAGNGTGDGDLPSGDPGSGVFFDTQGFDLGPWANRVVAIVRSNWIVPVAAQLGVKGVVGVAFKVERTGRIIDIRVITPSGTPSFDQAAANALKTSSPLPPLPGDFPRPVLPGVFRFYYNMPVPRE